MSGVGKQHNTSKDESPFTVQKADLAQVAHYRVNPKLCHLRMFENNSDCLHLLKEDCSTD